MTDQDLTELQIEISELERENQDLRERVKDLEVNLTYMSEQLGKPVVEKKPEQKISVH